MGIMCKNDESHGFFGAETPQRIPLCKNLNNLSKISIFSVYLSYKK